MTENRNSSEIEEGEVLSLEKTPNPTKKKAVKTHFFST